MLNSAFQVVKKQNKFIDRAIEDFTNVFIKQIAKLVKVVELGKKDKKLCPFNSLYLLTSLNFGVFLIKMGQAKR